MKNGGGREEEREEVRGQRSRFSVLWFRSLAWKKRTWREREEERGKMEEREKREESVFMGERGKERRGKERTYSRLVHLLGRNRMRV